MLNPGPGFRRIPCPRCGKGEIKLAAESATLQCTRMRWKRNGLSGGTCTFSTRDRDPATLGLKPGEMLAMVDFTPFAYQDPREA